MVLYRDVLAMNIFVFFFNDTATTEIYTLSLHDALPILPFMREMVEYCGRRFRVSQRVVKICRSEEHTSELQSQSNLVCRLLLEKKKIEMFLLVVDDEIRGENLYYIAIRCACRSRRLDSA